MYNAIQNNAVKNSKQNDVLFAVVMWRELTTRLLFYAAIKIESGYTFDQIENRKKSM